MKKGLLLIGIMVLAFSLIACGGNSTKEVIAEEPENTVEAETTSEASTKEETTATETETSVEEELAVGKRIPNYELTTLDGETVSLHDYDGKIILLNFWATW